MRSSHPLFFPFSHAPVGLLALLATCAATPAAAHNGPPFPILEKRTAGPYLITIWADPDVGQGTFYIFLDSVKGGPPPTAEVTLGVQPVTMRRPWAECPAKRGNSLGRDGYVALPQFDREEKWSVRVSVAGPNGNTEASTAVLVTPQGPALWEFFLYLAPFLAIGFLWINAFLRSRRAAPTPPAT
jgi:hypothetical protein